ncbi:hypothetical protein LEN26_001390 [Aphanomyces euteiches]|nr:hypothetical protein LEN26_001390 [Aphanomyces euteiches]
MHPRGLLVLSLAIATNALLTLTTCTKPNGTVVACLNDTIAGTTTDLASSRSGYYDFTNLGISSIQSWPLDAQSMYKSCFQQNQRHFNAASSLAGILNLSHNALQNNWLQTPITVRSLDVSYNQGGLPWMERISWATLLPRLTQLAFRGNRLVDLYLTFETFPLNFLSTLDLGENANLALTIDRSVYNRVNQAAFALSLNGAQNFSADCWGTGSFVSSLQSLDMQYDAQSLSVNRTTWKVFDACCKYCNYSPSNAPSPSWYYNATRPDAASTGTLIVLAFVGDRYCIAETARNFIPVARFAALLVKDDLKLLMLQTYRQLESINKLLSKQFIPRHSFY